MKLFNDLKEILNKSQNKDNSNSIKDLLTGKSSHGRIRKRRIIFYGFIFLILLGSVLPHGNFKEDAAVGFQDKYFDIEKIGSIEYYAANIDDSYLTNDTSYEDSTYVVNYLNNTTYKNATIKTYSFTEMKSTGKYVNSFDHTKTQDTPLFSAGKQYYVYHGYIANVTFVTNQSFLFASNSRATDEEYAPVDSDGYKHYSITYEDFITNLKQAFKYN